MLVCSHERYKQSKTKMFVEINGMAIENDEKTMTTTFLDLRYIEYWFRLQMIKDFRAFHKLRMDKLTGRLDNKRNGAVSLSSNLPFLFIFLIVWQ